MKMLRDFVTMNDFASRSIAEIDDVLHHHSDWKRVGREPTWYIDIVPREWLNVKWLSRSTAQGETHSWIYVRMTIEYRRGKDKLMKGKLSCFAVYSGLTHPIDIFGTENAGLLRKRVLCFGDNFAGDPGGFLPDENWRVIEIIHDSMRIHETNKSFGEFIRGVIMDGDV